MATNPDDIHSLEHGARWLATHAAVERTYQLAPQGSDGAPILESLVHPAYPFVAVDVPSGNGLPQRLREVAQRYLQRVTENIPESRAFAQANWETAAIPWHWYDLHWGTDDRDEGPDDARQSFWVEVDAAGTPKSRTAVLLAGPQWRDSDSGHQRVTGGGQGLRIVLHVSPLGHGAVHVVRITGATFAHPPVAARRASAQGLFSLTPIQLLLALRSLLPARLIQNFAVGEFSILPSGMGRIAGNSLAGTPGNPRVMSWALRTVANENGGGNQSGLSVQFEYLVEQMTHATNAIRATVRDPASSGPAKDMVKRRPTREAALISNYLQADNTKLPAPSGPQRILQEPGPMPRFTVEATWLAQNTLDPAVKPQRIPADDLALRSDDQAAAHAYLRGQELMARLDQSGLKPQSYFRFAKLPLILSHHAAMKKGNPDGHSVNAQVQPVGITQHFDEPFDPAKRPQLQVRFGAASLTHRDLRRTFTGSKRPQYMGLAADDRWAWHEFGHVLCWAATGDLEFAFAHSAGDALAAIISDPDSQLAHDNVSPAKRAEPAAGLTFPWVPIKRRHDRDASLGWCWCGRRNIRRLSPLAPGERVFTGYFAEQLLSSTLFRLYRALGGDTQVPEVRHKAADYAVYLIMRAMQLLGPSTCVAARQATHFYESLVQADVATTDWHYPMSNPSPPPASVRIGGMAHKLIRWAFEQQGLFAAEREGEIVEGMGRPPKVDIHVDDDRSATDGGYGPHALDWIDMPSLPAPGWHASAKGLAVQGAHLQFTVRNRGSEQADGVKAEAWAAKAVAGPLVWIALPLSADSNTVLSIGAGGSNHFKFDAEVAGVPLNGRYFLLASASCSADRSNLDPMAALPCAGELPTEPRQVAELVSGDNNVGLVLLDLP